MSVVARRRASTGELLVALGAALALRLLVGGTVGAALFAVVLLAASAGAGWRLRRPAVIGLAWGVAGAIGLVAGPAVLHVTGPHPLFHPSAAGFPLWAVVVTAVAVAEEALLRGVLFNAVEEVHGVPTALVVTTIAFAILHVPLYGMGALPLDLAVGLWLGGLRVVSSGVNAPATAHVLADLAGWWLW
jgi:membrane protease YdiL (CAAX protease family)